jgi:Domain of unknown function (DUF6791)
MSHRPVSLSPDLKRLRDEGYAVHVRSNHLLVSGIPYVNSRKVIVRGTLVSELTLAGEVAAVPSTHVMMFIGDHPCNKDGTEIAQIKHGSSNQDLGNGLVVNHSFSNKPSGGYKDYHHKFTRYIEIISNPARSLDPLVKADDFLPVATVENESVFNYCDTASSRAGITAVADKLAVGNVAIVGVGGTGSYVLDFVAKTPVPEIHLFDHDWLLNHNAFRSPGAPSLAQLNEKPRKVDYFADIYSRMRRGVVPHPYHIDGSNVDELRAMAFVFLCLDRGYDKRQIVEPLTKWGVPFIDVGMGIELVDGKLGGILRVTTVTPEKHDHVAARISFAEGGDDNYSSNIQIADLNALNATLAVGRWKKQCGFYRDFEKEHHSTYTTDCDMLHGEDKV